MEQSFTLKKPPVVKYPKRLPSIESLKRQIIYTTADKTTCAECPCFKDQAPYEYKPKLRPCLQSPLTLYELAEKVVDSFLMPEPFRWSVEMVAKWMEFEVGFPQYKECMIKNNICGLRLIMFDDISLLPRVNIRDFEHIKIILSHIRKLYGLKAIQFFRSIGLPTRLPLNYCTLFFSRTGPVGGIRKNWTNSDVLRWMKIIGPRPIKIDHWDLVWYEKPDFPKTLFARRPYMGERQKIVQYRERIEYSNEIQVPRQFKFRKDDDDSVEGSQMIWITLEPGDPGYREKLIVYKDIEAPKKKKKIKKNVMDYSKWAAEELILAKRKMPKPKFFKDASLKKKKSMLTCESDKDKRKTL